MSFRSKFPNFKQIEAKDCGPTCLKIISKFYGRTFSREFLRRLSETDRSGSTFQGLSNAAESLGLNTLGCSLSLKMLRDAPLPCILHWGGNHFVVLYKVTDKWVYISDPSYGRLKYSNREFLNAWIGNSANSETPDGLALLIEPSPKFYEIEFEDVESYSEQNYFLRTLLIYFRRYKMFFLQIILGLLGTSFLQLVIPFLTQSIVDVGIANQDINFIYLILFAQFAIFLGKSSIEIIRNWILLNLSTRINISMISNFFIQLMNLPISYFDVRMTGDIMQRIGDHRRIEKLLTSSSLNIVFSFFTILVLGGVLFYYDYRIFSVFLIGSILYFLWIYFFLKKREELDYKRFAILGRGQSKVIELINGMQEIKLHNAEQKKRWSWEHIQARLYKVSIKNLALEQSQQVGSSLINEIKNLVILFITAKLVIDGEFTLGTMLAVSYIVGQLNGPVSQVINFLREWQDAKISFARLAEVSKINSEHSLNSKHYEEVKDSGIILKDVWFGYGGAKDHVLENLDLTILKNEVTAIVGSSGSGKTTLLKLLLKFYEPKSGEIYFGKTPLKNVSQRSWRNNVGVVMQEGYIFNDTIANNIAIGEDNIDKARLEFAVKNANIQDFIESLPNNYNTLIGNEGIGISTGQKQRLFIARAIYKDPDILFFDEATSSLDAQNEKEIVNNLNLFFKERTVIIVAHRLSTVRNANKIVVLEKGRIVETGNHEQLVEKEGHYFNLIRNQLELV